MNSWVSEEGDKLIKKEDGNYKRPLHFRSFLLTQRAMGLLSAYCGRVRAYFAGGKRAALKRYNVVDKHCQMRQLRRMML